MTWNKTKAALVLAAILMLGVAYAPAFAQGYAPNGGITHEAVPLNMRPGGAGVYDRYDSYRTPQGFPLPGWGYLRGMS